MHQSANYLKPQQCQPLSFQILASGIFYLPFMHIIVFNIILPQFEIMLILKAQSDKTIVINLLVFK